MVPQCHPHVAVIHMDTLGIEPRASRMLSGCGTITPCALCEVFRLTFYCDEPADNIVMSPSKGEKAECIHRTHCNLLAAHRALQTAHCTLHVAHCTLHAQSGQMVPQCHPHAAVIHMDTLGIEPRATCMLSGCGTTTPCAR